MLLQRTGTGTTPPSVGGFATPCWESLAEAWDASPGPSSATVALGPTTVELGHDDFDTDDVSLDVRDYEFGWDNEHCKVGIRVGLGIGHFPSSPTCPTPHPKPPTPQGRAHALLPSSFWNANHLLVVMDTL